MKKQVLRFFTILLAMVMLISIVSGCTKPKDPNTDKPGKNGQEETNNGDEAFPVEIADTLGRKVTVEKRPEKIISVVPNATEILYALGLEDKIVGVSQQCDYPEEAAAKPNMGDFWGPDIELIVEAEPDLLFVGNKAPQEFLDKIEENNITVVVLEGLNLEGTYETIINAGKVTGIQKKAEELVESIKAEISRIQEKVKDADKPKAYFVVSYGEFGEYTAGAGSFTDELISLAGGENVAGDMNEEWAEYSMEKLIEKDPDIILITQQAQPHGLADAPGYKELTAIKEGRLVILDDNLVNRTGPRIWEGLEEIAKGLHPDLFE